MSLNSFPTFIVRVNLAFKNLKLWAYYDHSVANYRLTSYLPSVGKSTNVCYQPASLMVHVANRILSNSKLENKKLFHYHNLKSTRSKDVAPQEVMCRTVTQARDMFKSTPHLGTQLPRFSISLLSASFPLCDLQKPLL
jgi:hypothetical protein